jgi:hypothetical protein
LAKTPSCLAHPEGRRDIADAPVYAAAET